MAVNYPNLNANDIYGALYNQVVGITVEGKNIANKHANLLTNMRLDVSKYGDTKVFIDTDILRSYPFEQDSEDALNVLAVKRSQPVQTVVTIDKARQIMVTVDDFGISSRAFGSEGAFGAFNSAVVAWVSMTKDIYEACYYNALFGTTVADGAAQNISDITGTDIPTLAQECAKRLADLFVELSVPSRKYNDKKLMRSFDRSDVIMVWNSKYLSKIKKVDLPVLFHGENVMPDEEYTLAPQYFGNVNAKSGTGAKAHPDANTRVLEEYDIEYTVGGSGSTKRKIHLMPGQAIATEGVYYEGTTAEQKAYPKVAELTSAELNTIDLTQFNSYQEDSKIICKIVGKGALPFLTGVSAGTEFVNGKNNSRNHYLTWTFGDGRLDAKPLITIKEA